MLVACTDQYKDINKLRSALPMPQDQASGEIKNIEKRHKGPFPEGIRDQGKILFLRLQQYEQQFSDDIQEKGKILIVRLLKLIGQFLHRIKISALFENEIINKRETLRHICYELWSLKHQYLEGTAHGTNADTLIKILDAIIQQMKSMEKPIVPYLTHLDSKWWNYVMTPIVSI